MALLSSERSLRAASKRRLAWLFSLVVSCKYTPLTWASASRMTAWAFRSPQGVMASIPTRASRSWAGVAAITLVSRVRLLLLVKSKLSLSFGFKTSCALVLTSCRIKARSCQVRDCTPVRLAVVSKSSCKARCASSSKPSARLKACSMPRLADSSFRPNSRKAFKRSCGLMLLACWLSALSSRRAKASLSFWPSASANSW